MIHQREYPVLTGESARRFSKKSEENERRLLMKTKEIQEDIQTTFEGIHDRNEYAQIALKYTQKYQEMQKLLKSIEKSA